ncbi:hypothetical protein WMY93_021063 [Mugilogobius chulae]|uniref:Complement component C7 n=1 Tax=Mugilogobius chulae TaxID=88201 RepID=A0AAW0NGQ4_9GOBI
MFKNELTSWYKISVPYPNPRHSQVQVQRHATVRSRSEDTSQSGPEQALEGTGPTLGTTALNESFDTNVLDHSRALLHTLDNNVTLQQWCQCGSPPVSCSVRPQHKRDTSPHGTGVQSLSYDVAEAPCPVAGLTTAPGPSVTLLQHQGHTVPTLFQVRTRHIQVFAQFGGALCPGTSFDVQPCSTHKQCPLQDGCGGRFRCSSARPAVQRDQDCEDGLDEARCEDSHYACDTQKSPPNSDLTGRGMEEGLGEEGRDPKRRKGGEEEEQMETSSSSSLLAPFQEQINSPGVSDRLASVSLVADLDDGIMSQGHPCKKCLDTPLHNSNTEHMRHQQPPQQQRKTQEQQGRTGKREHGILQGEGAGVEAGRERGKISMKTCHPSEGRKFERTFKPVRPILILGSSNVGRVPPIEDSRFQMEVFPGTRLQHVTSLLSRVEVAPQCDSAAVVSVWLLLLSPVRAEAPVSCRWSDYGPWSLCDPCSSTKVRTRHIQVFAQFGGALCPGTSFDVQPCSTHKQCPLQDGCGGRFRCSSGRCIRTELLCNGDQDCEDGLDEARCEDSHYACDTQKTPPNSELSGRGYNAVTGQLRASVLNTLSFGGQCRRVFSADSGTHYRLPHNLLRYDLQVTVDNEESDESYESSWSYMKHVQTKALFTNYKQTFHHELSENKAHRVIVLKNRVVLGHFQNSAPAYLTLLQPPPAHLRDALPVRGGPGGQYTALLQLQRHAMQSTSTTDIEYQRCWRKVKRRLFRKKVTVTCERLTQALASEDGFQRSSMPIAVKIVGGDVSLIAALSVLDLQNPERNGQHYDNWAASVRDFPQVIEPKLRPLYDLVKEVPAQDSRSSTSDGPWSSSSQSRTPVSADPVRTTGPLCCQRASAPVCVDLGRPEKPVRAGPTDARRLELLVAVESVLRSGGGSQCVGLSVERTSCEDPDMEHLRLMEPQCLGLSVPPPKTCPAPPALPNGFVLSPKDMYLLGDRVEFSCIHGYHLQGGAVSTCTEQQKWSTERRRCEVSACSAPELQTHVTVSPLKQSYEMGESVSLSCPPGLHLDGEVSQSMCSSSLQWSPSPEHTRCQTASTAPPAPSGLKCAPWQNVGRRGCVCKTPAQCPPSLLLCADLGPLKRALGVCQLGALRCLGRSFSLLTDEQCSWEEPSCESCGPGTRCDESSHKCVCGSVSKCPPDSTPLCAIFGASGVAVTTSECEVGVRRCNRETVRVTGVEPCPES